MATEESRPLLEDAPGDNSYGSCSNDVESQSDKLRETAGIPLETAYERKVRIRMLTFIFFLQFFLVIQEAIYFTVLWPYLREIDDTADEAFFGYVLGIYAIVSTFSNPILGYTSNRLLQTKTPLLIGMTASVIGNIGTTFAGNLPAYRKWGLFASRMITGVGGGSLGVIGSYTTMATTITERNKALSIRSAISAGGLLLAPAVASIFSFLDYPGVSLGALHVNMYTAPAILGVVTFTICMLLVVVFFKEQWVSVAVTEMTRTKNSGSQKLAPFDYIPVVVCIIARFTIRFSETYDQAIGSPLTMTMFHWNSQEAISYNGAIKAVTGTMEFAGNLFVGMWLVERVPYRRLIPIGTGSLIVYFAISFAYPGLPPLIYPGTNLSSVDCNYTWCAYTSRIYLWQYILANFVMFAAFSLCYAPTNILFSRLFGPRKQGVYQGIYMSTSQFAAATAPIIVTNIFEYLGPRVAWALAACMLAAVFVMTLVCNRHLIPYEEQIERLDSRKK